MGDEITDQRLKKKVLERWENEGGRIIAESAGSDDGGPKSGRQGEPNQPSGSHGNSPAGAAPTPAKERRPAEE
jgi:hypothetical protein